MSPEGRQVRDLLRGADRAALATVLADGGPYASLVLTALAPDATPLLLLSDLAEHSRNIAREPRVSLLFDGTAGLADPLTGARASLVGRAAVSRDRPCWPAISPATPRPRAMPPSPISSSTGSRSSRAHLVAGFGKIRWVEATAIRLEGIWRPWPPPSPPSSPI